MADAQNHINNGNKTLNDHFSRLESMLADLNHKVEVSSGKLLGQSQNVHPPDPVERIDRARQMLAELGSITATDIQVEMGVSHTTAMRTLQTLARQKEGVMVFEPAGPTFRIRLWHPDRVILDHVVR